MKLDYVYYTEVYGSDKVKEEEFKPFLRLAERYVDKITFNRIEERDMDILNATCMVMDILKEYGVRGGAARESNDGYTIEYEKKDVEKEIYKVLRIYLPSYLLYKGVEL